MRRNSVLDAISAFNGIYDTANRVARDYEIAKVANATPEQTQGFTAEQGEAIRKAAESGADVQYDDAAKAYVITPKAMAEGDSGPPAPVQTIAQQGVTDFMGKRTTGAMTDSQVNNARERAMAGVISKYDPIQGQRMMRDVTQSERDDVRFGQDQERYGWEKSRAQREERTAAQAEKDDQDRRALDADVGEWFKGRLVGADGQARAATVDDHLAASQYRAGKLIEAGKVDAANQVMKEFNAQSLVKIQLQSAERDQALGKTAAALAAGDLNAVKDFYNTYIPDGAHVTAVSKGPKGEIVIQRESMDGKPMPATTLKDVGQLTSALASFKDPMAIYNWTQNEFRNNLALRADARAGAAEGRAATEFKDRASQREAAKSEADLRVELAGIDDTTAEGKQRSEQIQAKLLALKTGTRGAMAGHDPADVIKAKKLHAEGRYSSEAEALDAVITKPDKMFQEFQKAAAKDSMDADKANENAGKMMEANGWVRNQSGTWRRAGMAASVGTFDSVAEVEAAAKAGKVKKGDKVTVGGRTATWQ